MLCRNGGIHCGPEQAKIQIQVLAFSLLHSLFARTAHSFACSILLATLARSAALIFPFACSITPLWESE